MANPVLEAAIRQVRQILSSQKEWGKIYSTSHTHTQKHTHPQIRHINLHKQKYGRTGVPSFHTLQHTLAIIGVSRNI